MNNAQARDVARDGWHEHKKELAEWIERISPSPTGAATARVAVIGAGNCSDIPLEQLCRSFGEVHLFDMDWRAISEARSAVDPALAQRISCFSHDVTGLYTTFVPRVLRYLHEGDSNRALRSFQKFAASAGVGPRLGETYNLVLSLNVVSQLFCPFMHSLAHAAAHAGRFASEDSFAALLRWIRKIGDTRVIQEHARFLYTATDGDGRVLISTDRFFWGFDHGEPTPAAQWLREPEEMLEHENLERMGRAGLALPGTGILPFCRELFELRETRRWLWRFNREQVYLVEGYEMSPGKARRGRPRHAVNGE